MGNTQTKGDSSQESREIHQKQKALSKVINLLNMQELRDNYALKLPIEAM